MIDTPPEPPVAQEQVIERKLLDCGLKSEGFTVRYEDELQSIQIIITPSAQAKPEHFVCIREAAGYEIVTFEDTEMFGAYLRVMEDLARPKVLADAEISLKERGLWENFPKRSDYAAFADYLRALEIHAGFAPGSVLQAEADQRVRLEPSSAELFDQVSYERWAVLLAVLKFASARDGFPIGFVGNDKYRE
ncbi:hypothetical protein [Erythrobacter sp. CCH5-A1]|jgi:hypothetical protein|uniref:hypothetical protein n=1 Tax=Erythrobacter sp. CCH5-A1 TaxID=1768792 RepID=UPI0008375BFD|nr:hypothetical protein [Erythrobacter sp. CCH5-A1]